MLDKTQVSEHFKALQDRICAALETEDGGRFKEDLWTRAEGGGGRTRILEGQKIEKGGVLYSAVHGPMPQKIADKLGLPRAEFYATGVSIVLHPHNPHVPIIHMNVRYFEMDNGTWWFGGGIDLTPHYVHPADAQFFHQQLKATCDRFDPSFYPKFKTWADDYFYLKHRQETRGVGGIFFDRLSANTGYTQEQLLDYAVAVGDTFAPTYTHFLRQYADKPFTEAHRRWQCLRRGRYVEFNLVWDKGTKFGLDTNGRTESILMSMPPEAQWTYDYRAPAGSAEAETLGLLRKGIDWVNGGTLVETPSLKG